jgi:DNA helicase HerA-like ATPase
MPASHLLTHGVVVGMTGSGKTGLLVVMVEEALMAGVPVLMIDVKGDLPNLLLSFPSFAPEPMEPWAVDGPDDERTPAELATAIAGERKQALEAWGIRERELADFRAKTHVRVLTPGSEAGEPLHVLSSLERRSSKWDTDPDAARSTLSAAVSLILRLLGRDPDPAKSKEHVLLSVLAERRLAARKPSDIGALLEDLSNPPIESIGALALDQFLPKKARKDLAAALNTLLASPSFASWRKGVTLDPASWLSSSDGKTSATIISVAHLDDEERALVLGVVLEEVLTWVRGLSGSRRLRALVVFDEVYGYLPPYPANPPTKRSLVALMKQARAYGVGVVLATQNPMDLDYRALGNAGLWCIGRLQTDADRARVIEGLGGTSDLEDITKRLAPRWFLMRDAQSGNGTVLLQPRWAMSYLRGPMTGPEIHRALAECEHASPSP